MADAQKEKKSKKSGKQKAPSTKPSESSQHAHPPFTSPVSPSHMLPPPTFYPPGQALPTKVAIPRLRQDSDGRSTSASGAGDKNRVTHACEPCRHRKTKCTGERPKCKHCEDFKLDCVYVDGKRDRARKELGNMAGKLDEYERLLREVSVGADGYTRERIARALQREPSPELDGISPMSPRLSESQPSRITEEPSSSYGEERVSARVGSTDAVDKVDEDFNRDAAARATGYHGKNSEVTWMQRLRQQTASDNDERDGDSRSGAEAQDTWLSAGLTPMSNSTYHCDDLSVLITDQQVDAYEAPPRQVADMLFQSYLETVHPTFPIIGKTTFVSQYQDYFGKQRVPHDNWLAILNVIFAIGAKYAHLIKADWRGDERDHLIYFTRARMLGFNSDTILGHAELQRVQVSGLMGFYLMAINQINRSWAISGIAIRHASTLGLNLRNDSPDITDFSKEIRYRLWWALCFLERQLAVMTGRPTSFSDADCSSPLPLPVDESGIVDNPLLRRWSSHGSRPNESVISTPSSGFSLSKMATSPGGSQSPVSQSQQAAPYRPDKTPHSVGLYFLHHTKLSIFTNQVLSRLYRVANLDKSWAETQSTMAELQTRLEIWRDELPSVFNFTRRIRDQQWIRQRTSLGFFYYSTMLIINRPCLCRVDRKIPNESGNSKEFNQATAAKCVHAAIDMLNLLPDEPNPVGMYAQCPWWCLVHHLVEAAVVCMLEMSFRADHMPNEVDEVFESADKAVQWLRSMASSDLAASRAWRMCDEMLRKVSPKVGKSVTDMLSSQHHGTDPMQGQSFNPQVEAVGPGMSTPQHSGPYQPPMFTTYDQMVAQGQLPPGIARDPSTDMHANLFPSATEMEALGFGDQPAQGYFENHDQNAQWFADGGS